MASQNDKVEFDRKWIKGLVFSTVKEKKEKTEDGETIKQVSVERPLQPEDILDWRVYGSEVVMATADGRKYRVEK